MSLLFNPIEDCFDLVGLTEAIADTTYLRQDQNLADLDDAATARVNLSLVVGTNVQAYDATLQSISALGTAADRMLYTTGVDTWAEQVTTAYGRSLLTPANAIAGRILLDAQQLDATLTALAGLTIAANSLTIGTGVDAFTQTTFAANTFPARASTGDLVAKSITDFALTLLDDADAATARTTLGLVAGGAGDIWVEKAGDEMTGLLTIDINSDSNLIKLINNVTQTNALIVQRNSADSGNLSGLNGNGRWMSVGSTSSGFAITSSDFTTTTHLVMNHTTALGSIVNNTGSLSIEGVASNEIVFNNVQADVNIRFESDTDQNFLFLDAGLNTMAIGGTADSVKKLTISQSSASTGNPTTLVVNATQTAAAATTLKGATFNIFMTHTSGSLSGGNVTEYNINASGNGGTSSTVEGLNFGATVGTGHTVSTMNYIHLYAPTVNGTLSTFRAILTEAGNIIFNEQGGDYDVRIEGDTDTELMHIDASVDNFGIGIGSPTAKLHVDQSSTTGAKPVLTLDQADLSEEFIRFVATVGAGNPIDTAAAGTYYGKIRVYIDGVGAKFISLANT